MSYRIRIFTMKWTCLLIGVGLITIGCSRVSAGEDSGSPESEKAQYAKEDASDFASGKEARAWLADQNHVFFKVSKETVTKLVADLYDAGAAEVRISGADKVEEMGNKEFGGMLVVKLPGDAAKRKPVFALLNQIWQKVGDDPAKDDGQQYASLTLD